MATLNVVMRVPPMLLAAALVTAPVAVTAQEAFPPATPESQNVSAPTLDSIGAIIRSLVDTGEIVGAEFLVIRNRRTVLHEGFGWRHREEQVPMEPGTIFNLRSMTKPIVGSIAQRQIDQQVLELDAPAGQYLSSFAGGTSADILVRQLLTHTSGLPDGNPAGSRSDYPTLRSVADFWGTHGPTEFEPGEGFQYSDPGTDVLGAIVEEIAGQTLRELADSEVFDPLGMTDSHAWVDSETSLDPRFASDYRYSSEQGAWVRYWKPGDGSPLPFAKGSGTTWYATAQDYARLLAAWMDAGDDRWLGTAAAERALTPTPVSPFDYPSRLPGLQVRYGQMWIVYVDGEGNRAAFGHSGSDGTYAYAWPEDDLIVLYMTQSRGNRTRLLLEPLFAELVQD
jgi:CubicO group peptidase (beta-lactamase class C family)